MLQQNEPSELIEGLEASLEQCPKKFKDTFDKLRYKIQVRGIARECACGAREPTMHSFV